MDYGPAKELFPLTKIIAPFLAILFCAVFISNCARANPEEIPLTIATYNINFSNQNLDKVIKAIKGSGADIILLQETIPASEEYFRKNLGAEYPNMAFQGYKGKYYAERFGFLSKYPIQKTTYLDPKYGLFGTYIARIHVQNIAIQLVNIHLDPVNIFKDRTILGFLKALAIAEKNHLDEIKYIVSKLDKKTPTIIAGDFNGKSESSAVKHLKEVGFEDSFAEVNDKPDEQPTWEWPLRTGKLSARFDFIFHDASFKTTKSRIIRNNSSDHFLVYSVLTYSKQKGGN